jgi:hypothetical protein
VENVLMPVYTFPITADRADALHDRGLDDVQAFLVGRGLTVDGVSLSLDPPTLKVRANADPSSHLASLSWPTKRDYAAARQAMKAFMQKVNAGQTPTNLEVIQAIRGIIVELARD